MHEAPPVHLSELLQRLGLATERDLQQVEPTVHRLAGDLPRFQSVWVDALRQARLLTQFQAAEIIAGRGDKLRTGRYVLCHIVQECIYNTVYKAEDFESHEPFRLTVCSAESTLPADWLPSIEKLITLGRRVPELPGLVTSAGQDGTLLWAAAPWIDGTSLAEWMLHHGRFPPAVVLEIARAMLGALASMESVGLVHGDIRAENVLLLPDGAICLPQPGLRAIVRPHEGISNRDISPEACGTLSPERVASTTPPNITSDIFACGCVWWQMLCGRPPLGGGDTLTRLRAAQSAAIDDFRRWANDVPAPLADAITACLHKDPRKRPASMTALAQQLGTPGKAGRMAIVRCLSAAARPQAPWLQAKRARAAKQHPHVWTAATLLVLALVAVAWPLWVAANRPRAAGSTSASVDALKATRSAGAPAQARQSGPRLASASGLYGGPGSPSYDSRRRAPQRPAASEQHESAVVQAGYGEPLASNNTLWLPASCVIPADKLRLEPGQVVRAKGGRTSVTVPQQGLEVLPDRVTFENVDFVADDPVALVADVDAAGAALVHVAGAQCAFVGCSFQSVAGRPELRAAIRVVHGATSGAAAGLPSGRIRITNCVFRRVAAAVQFSGRGALALELVNSLHLGPGPMVRLIRCPTADEPLRIVLSQVTLRDANAAVELRDQAASGNDPAGEITVDASACVFALPDDAAVLLLACQRPALQLLQGVKWAGRGSVVGPRVAFARWQHRSRQSEVVNDATLSISGLVRGRIDFAGPCDGNPSNCRILQCLAPREDSDSLGASPLGLPADVEISTRHQP